MDARGVQSLIATGPQVDKALANTRAIARALLSWLSSTNGERVSAKNVAEMLTRADEYGDAASREPVARSIAFAEIEAIRLAVSALCDANYFAWLYGGREAPEPPWAGECIDEMEERSRCERVTDLLRHAIHDDAPLYTGVEIPTAVLGSGATTKHAVVGSILRSYLWRIHYLELLAVLIRESIGHPRGTRCSSEAPRSAKLVISKCINEELALEGRARRPEPWRAQEPGRDPELGREPEKELGREAMHELGREAARDLKLDPVREREPRHEREARHEPRHEPRHEREARHEPRHEARHEPRHEREPRHEAGAKDVATRRPEERHEGKRVRTSKKIISSILDLLNQGDDP